MVDGNKVRILYRGNSKTCARCHKHALQCKGGGLARNCGVAGGEHVPLSTHMKSLWEEIGFEPVNFELDDSEVPENDSHQAELDKGLHVDTPQLGKKPLQEPSERDIMKFDGITIKNIPTSVEDKQLFEFLFQIGPSR